MKKLVTISEDDGNDGSNNGTPASKFVQMSRVWIQPGRCITTSLNHDESFSSLSFFLYEC